MTFPPYLCALSIDAAEIGLRSPDCTRRSLSLSRVGLPPFGAARRRSEDLRAAVTVEAVESSVPVLHSWAGLARALGGLPAPPGAPSISEANRERLGGRCPPNKLSPALLRLPMDCGKGTKALVTLRAFGKGRPEHSQRCTALGTAACGPRARGCCRRTCR